VIARERGGGPARERARDYELTSAARREQDDEDGAAVWLAISVALAEVADALDDEAA
jgi:hypothetical protein